MEIEIGKKYWRRERLLDPVEITGEAEGDDKEYGYAFVGVDKAGNLRTYRADGLYFGDGKTSVNDLVEEVVEEAKIEAAQAINPPMTGIDAIGGQPVTADLGKYEHVPFGRPAPVTFPVAILDGASTELQLMHALEQVMLHFAPSTDVRERERAAKWLHDRNEVPF